MSQRLCQPFTKCHHTPTVRLFPHPPLFCFGLIWLGLCSFPPHATCGTQFLILALLHFKPVKKLGGTFVLTTPGPSERGECVVQILKKVVAPDFEKKTNYLQHRIIHHRTLKIWSASPPPVSFVIICPSLFTLITGIATLAILLIPTHHDDDDDDVVMAPMAKRMLLSYGPIACHGLQL